MDPPQADAERPQVDAKLALQYVPAIVRRRCLCDGDSVWLFCLVCLQGGIGRA